MAPNGSVFQPAEVIYIFWKRTPDTLGQLWYDGMRSFGMVWDDMVWYGNMVLVWYHGRGLYCPPLIPARIRWNPGNSQNSRGIKFGRGACQIDEMIPAEFWMAFKFCRNSSRNYLEGMLPEFNGTESMTPKSSVGKCRHSIWASWFRSVEFR